MTTDCEMPRYQCHKRVHALKICSFAIDSGTARATITPEDGEYAPFEAPMQWNGTFKGGDDDMGYYVVYDDGYASWSPSKAFEEGYTRL